MNNQTEDKKQVESKMVAPRILCEIFIYGTEDEKPKIKKLLDELQLQMNKAKRNRNRIRVCFYIDKGELSVNDKLDWFAKEGKCKYYKVLNAETKLDKDFVKNILEKIRKLENAINSMKLSEIKVFTLKENKKKTSKPKLSLVGK
jgi:hypothetical protein